MALEETTTVDTGLLSTIRLKLPAYVPLQNDLVRDFDKSSNFQNSVSDKIKASMNDIVDTIDRYFNTLANTSDHSLNMGVFEESLQSMGSLIECELKLHTYRTATSNGKKRVKATTRDHPDISLNTLEYFHDTEANGNLYDDAINEYHDNIHSTSYQEVLESFKMSNESYRYAKNCAFIIQNPEAPLPDEVADEELAVSGGNISLRDPISMNYFEDPVVSKQCNHTYERKSIERYLETSNRSNACPISGCSSSLSRRDLRADKTMLLRIKAFQFHEKNKKSTAKMERVI